VGPWFIKVFKFTETLPSAEASCLSSFSIQTVLLLCVYVYVFCCSLLAIMNGSLFTTYRMSVGLEDWRSGLNNTHLLHKQHLKSYTTE